MLPQAFTDRMRALLAEDFSAFLREMTEMPARHALRLNTLKCETGDPSATVGFPLTPIPYAQNGFYHN